MTSPVTVTSGATADVSGIPFTNHLAQPVAVMIVDGKLSYTVLPVEKPTASVLDTKATG